MSMRSIWLVGALAIAGLLLAIWWQRRRERNRASALSTLAHALRTPAHEGPGMRRSSPSILPPGLLASGETPAVAPRRRRAVPRRHAPYVPDAPLPIEESALPLFQRGPHRFARNLLATAGENHDLYVFDYGASEERVDESSAVTVALFRSRVLHLPEEPVDSESPRSRASLSTPVLERIERDSALVVEGSGPWLAVYHREGLIPDDELETFVDDARSVHDLLAFGPESAGRD